MQRKLSLTTVLVRDYSEAVEFYCGKLGFDLREDTELSQGKRWVVAGPSGSAAGLLLAKASSDSQWACIGNQSGGRVFLFLETDDFWRDHAAFLAAGVVFVESPRAEPYGTVAVFEDLYGNRWDLIQSSGTSPDTRRDRAGQ